MTSSRPEIGSQVEVLLTDARGVWTLATVIAPDFYWTPANAARVVTTRGTVFDVPLTNVRGGTAPAKAPTTPPPCVVCGVPSEWDTAAGAVCTAHCDEF